MFGFSAGEILLIALIAIVLFGNEQLPENMKKFLKGWNQTKKVASDLQHSWQEIKFDLKKDIEKYEENGESMSHKEHLTNKASPTINPAQHIVSQEEIDNFHNQSTSEIIKDRA